MFAWRRTPLVISRNMVVKELFLSGADGLVMYLIILNKLIYLNQRHAFDIYTGTFKRHWLQNWREKETNLRRLAV